MNRMGLPENKEEALRIVAKLSFRDFTEGDWRSYSGIECETSSPLIANVTSSVDAIIDGDVVFFWNGVDVPEDNEKEWAEFRIEKI